MSKTTRRVVTGLDANGKSCFVIDGEVPVPGDMGVGMIWRTDAIPADNSGNADPCDRPFDFDVMHSGGSTFLTVEYPPGMGSEGEPGWHATDTIDYIVVLTGEVVLMVEDGEVTMRPGDFFVDRGVVHAWRNDGDVPTRIAVVNLPSHPVGKGRTV